MPRSTFLWVTPLFAGACLAQVALASCSNLGTAPVQQPNDPYGWNDATASLADPGGNSSGAPSGGSSGAGSGGGASGGSSGSVSSSGGNGPPASSGAGSSGGLPDPGDGGSDVYIGYCGTGHCDYHNNTCCLPGDASVDAAYCVPGINYACGANIVTYHCLGAIDCTVSGEVCCGVYDLTAMTAGTACQKGPCTNPQFCLSNQECGSSKCTAQSCQGVSPLYLCGLQSGPPYSCTSL